MSKEVIIGKEYVFSVAEFNKDLSNADKEKVEWAWKKEGGEIQYFEKQGYIDDQGNVSKKISFDKNLAGEKVYVMPFLEEPDPSVSVIIQVLTPVLAKEILLITGTEKESETFGNKLMFMAQTVREVKVNYPDQKYLTVLYYPDDYSSEQIGAFKEAILNFNDKTDIIEIDTRQKMIDYINTKTIDASINDRELPNDDNDIVQIGTLKIFSHGMPSRFTFGLGWPIVPVEINNVDQEFNKTHVPLLQKEAFAADAELYSFACRSGNNSTARSFVGPGYNVEYYPINPRSLITTTKFFETRAEAQRFYDDKNSGLIAKAIRIEEVPTPFEQAKPQESLAQDIANHLDIKVYTYLVRSNYADTWKDNGDEIYKAQYEYYEDEDAHNPLNPKDWVRAYRSSGGWDEVIWNPQGAYGPVKAGYTPDGLPRNLYLFTKDAEPVAQ
ncbi:MULTISPECIES: hypothetical protein [Aquimarina]|uniref:hypothetical protein n=1 Tax=Aquimarina TaxID=290174 RepID=UPI00042A621C|nr:MULTISPECIES: hypothetical protein [Aquimarina]